jgi:hypothetical protein
MRPCSRIIIPLFLNRSTLFVRHTAHHHELKNCNCSLQFYIRLWSPAAVMAGWKLQFPLSHDSCPANTNVCKTRGCNYSFWAPDDERCRSKHVEQLRNNGIINSSTRSHLVGYFYKICGRILRTDSGGKTCYSSKTMYLLHIHTPILAGLLGSNVSAETDCKRQPYDWATSCPWP